MKGFNDILDIYTDESASKSQRFRSICAISGLSNNLEKLKEELKSKINLYGLSELKFAEVRTHQPRVNCAKDFISVAVDYASRREIRIGVIIWDLHDSRHSIQGRDDRENLERMYFHLLRNIVERWKRFNCRFYPDEHSKYNYKKIVDYLSKTKYPREEPYILELFRKERRQFNFIDVKEQKSEEQVLIQLADLFAGIACFSRENANNFKSYKKKKEDETEDIGKTFKNRFELIELIKKECEECKIKISLNTCDFLKTFKPSQPINFWHYEPQGEYDKAPTRKK
ncbi:DUF3800 domain-containing protein [Thermodesulfobium sp. 4217-1]|uniref:DUF3800 domain-containing protein n=1 Tax=Thermodesulfobium sp. 4217-1 TaxID=3120013 RepID=UPI0032214872